MHPIRRRKKRPNYGVRTVEVSKGKSGFGFTISGQQPCILSCIVNGSPAERAGLRPGDYLVAVNGQSVSKVPHDDVVRLIGCSNGILRLQIAENYYSDSSDEEHMVTTRTKPKYMHHRGRNAGSNQQKGTQQNRVAKVVRDLRSGAMFDKFGMEVPIVEVVSGGSVVGEAWDLPPLPPPRPASTLHAAEPKEQLSFLLGYLGTIEMPKQIQAGYRSQVVRGCIKRLRAEKRSHNWVLMKVHSDGVTLAGNGGKILAEYPVSRITYCGASSDEDKKYIGLVTIAAVDNGDVSPSSSCHVFAVQANLFEHHKHAAKAVSFKVECTHGTISEGCFEFPGSSEPILNAIRSFCLTNEENSRQVFDNGVLLANSPQPSQAGSTAASSNSDSGIGFRDDCGNQSDRIVMVDIENQRLHIQQLYNSKNAPDSTNSLDIQLCTFPRSSDVPSANLQQAFACVNALCPLPVNLEPRCGPSSSMISHMGHSSQRLTVRAIPEPSLNISNRSRSPLNSPSSSDDSKPMYSKGLSTRHKSKMERCLFGLEPGEQNSESCKSLPSTHDQLMLYHLGLTSEGSSSPYKRTSKSSDNLGHPNECSYKTDFNFDIISNHSYVKLSSKSSDNLLRSCGDVVMASSEGDDNARGVTMLGKGTSPLSISYGEGAVLERVRETFKAVKSADEEDDLLPCSSSREVLLSYSMTPQLHITRHETPFLQISSEKSMSFSPKRIHFKSADDVMSICSYRSNDALLTYKLSPKVFGVSRPLITQSLEDVNTSFRSRPRTWGSLQDLRSCVSSTLETASVTDMVFAEKESLEEDDKDEIGVVSWSSSLEKLLDDPVGLLTFAEFLKKEFSQENITFWVSCEKYRKLNDDLARKKLAVEIYETHLAVGATEPVNVDAHAHQSTQENLSAAGMDLFVAAQKQIFNLMKFDSFPRFIKSDLYKECLLRELSGQKLPLEALDVDETEKDGAVTPSRGKLKKSRSDAEDCRRKSLLPWHRKNRSKSKDRGESEYKLSTVDQRNEDAVSVKSDMTSSRSSLASWDLALRGSFSRQSITSGDTSELCRVILHDGATTVVQVRTGESVRELVHRLLEKRGLQYSAFEVFPGNATRPLSLDEEAVLMGSKEVRVERRVVFRLDLPNRKTVSVKAKTTKTLGQVLRPVLHKYSYRLEAVTICSMSDNEVLELTIPITAVDGRRLTVLTRSGDTSHQHVKTFVKPMAPPTLDEITNRVFEELLQGKSDDVDKSAPGSVKSEEWGSEHSSGVLGRFLRRDSALHDKTRSKPPFLGVTTKPPLVNKWRSATKHQGKSDSDELYEGLKRAQRSRLEDQRGTEINFELPDFLKDKENAPQNVKKLRKFRQEDGTDEEVLVAAGATALSNLRTDVKFNGSNVSNVSSRSVEASQITDPSLASRKPDDHPWASKLLTCKTYETPKTSAIKNEAEENSAVSVEDVSPRPLRKCEPPPLPPKPKYLPPKSSGWGQPQNNYARIHQQVLSKGNNFLKPSDIKRDARLARSRRAVYLDQPSSSFV